jgi:hypothetical protein
MGHSEWQSFGRFEKPSVDRWRSRLPVCGDLMRVRVCTRLDRQIRIAPKPFALDDEQLVFLFFLLANDER